ncbi:WYL domain-containing transcriptional regulator [Ignavibacterium sp.]|uniref:helix-turn-helix transcriptional regulator n=1 Tax=Ignavibacterium sp. TaxID=2651167 RepID=UPI00307E752B
MFDFQTKFKRQIEIIGICLSPDIQKPVRTYELATLFNVEELTIKRDLKDLRSYGIDIHSTKREGVCITSELSNQKLIDIILDYTSLNHNDYALDKSTSLLVEKLGVKALSSIVALQLCIDNDECAIIDYNKVGTKIEQSREVEPLLIFQNEGSWRLLAGSDGKMKQFLLDKITCVRSTGKKFRKKNYNVKDLFKYSWKTWLGEDKYHIKLWLSEFWAERVKPRILVTDQKLTKQQDDSVIFECTVNSLNEIAGWIVSRGEGVKVLEPEELRTLVINLAEGTLKNYSR